MNSAETLTSLAILKVNAERKRRDYYDLLSPFIIFVLSRSSTAGINSSETQKLVYEEFGLLFPYVAIELVLKRLAKAEILTLDNHVYQLCDRVPIPDIEAKRAEIKRGESAVISGLKECASSRYKIMWSDDQAISAIISYLSQFSIECLRTYVQGSALPDVESLRQRDLFIVSAFVRHIHETSPDLFESLVMLVKGHMLANALICSDLQSLPSQFKGVYFFFDTPIIVDLLEINGEYRKAVSKELLELLKNLRGTPAIFSHTAQEVHGVLRALQTQIDNPSNHSQVVDELRARGISAIDIALKIGGLNQSYLSWGIVQRDTPQYEPVFQIDEKLLEEALDHEIRYLNPKALLYDINSIRSIYALRKGKAPTRLEGCAAVLVTSNSAFAKVTFQYGQENEASREVSVVITDFSLANIAWLKAPLKAPELPRLELIATSYAALEPAEPLWAKYAAEIDKLARIEKVTPEMHQHLRYSVRATDELMNLTCGSEEAFSSHTVPEIIERVEKDIAGKHIALLEEERTLHEKTKNQLLHLMEDYDNVQDRFLVFSKKMGSWAGKVVFVLLILTLLGFSVVTGFLTRSFFTKSWMISILVSLLVLFGLSWSVVINSGLGISVKEVAHKTEGFIQRKIYDLLHSLSVKKRS